MGKKVFDPESENYKNVLINFADAAIEVGESKQAFKANKEWLAILKKEYGKDAIELYDPHKALGDSLVRMRYPKKASKHYDKAIRLASTYYGDDSIRYAHTMWHAGKNFVDIGYSDIAKKYLKSSFDIFLKYDDYRASLVKLYLGKAGLQQKKYAEASEYFEEALILADTEKDNKIELTARAFLVKAYENQGLSDLATQHCLEIGRQTPWDASQEAQPLYMSSPNYPDAARLNGKSGSVFIEFEISKMGFAKNFIIKNSGSNKVFHEPSLDVLKKARFAPKFENGHAVVAKSFYKFSYKIRK